jgi:hypothetical protein
MLYVAVALVVVVLGWTLLRGFLTIDPARLAQMGATFGMPIAGVLVVLALAVGIIARSPLLLLLGVAGLAGVAYLFQQQRQSRLVDGPRMSAVETDFLSMRLEHDSGVMSGTIKNGAFQGRHLSELNQEQLLDFWRLCRVGDEQAAALMEAYLDRLAPGWRESAERQNAPRGRSGAMTRAEAYAVLGLAENASEAEVREAHHRLMRGVHPDHGGSTYLAAKLNEARDLLLGA